MILKNLPFIGGPKDRVIVVGQDRFELDTIGEALTEANALDPVPSAANPVHILVGPGSYVEANPLTVPDGVTIKNLGAPAGVSVVATTPTDAIFEVTTDLAVVSIKGIGVTGASGAGGTGFKVSGGGILSVLECSVTNCETGFHSTGTGTAQSTLRGYGCLAQKTFGATLDAGLLVDAGAFAQLALTTFTGIPTIAEMVDGVRVEGAGSNAILFSSTAEFCTDGVHCDDTGQVFFGGGAVVGCDNAIHTGSTGSPLVATSGVSIQISDVWDILMDGAGQVVFGGVFDASKISIQSNSVLQSGAFSNFPGDEAFTVLNELHVGSEFAPSETCLGGGDSHTRGMIVQTNTNGEAGTWSDETAIASSQTGSTFTLFPGVAANNAVYIGGDQEFPGVKVITTVAQTLGGGDYELEFWDGVAWTDLPYMVSDADSPYAQRAEDSFTLVNSEHIRFGDTTGWATKLLNGETKYWVRFIIGTAITTSPDLEQVKLHTDRTEVNGDGRVEYFGSEQQVRDIPVDNAALTQIVQALFLPPTSKSLNFSTFTDIGYTLNTFPDAQITGVGSTFPYPEGLNSALPFSVTFDYTADNNNTGNVSLFFVDSQVTLGSILNGGTADNLTSQLVNIPVNSLDVLAQASFSILRKDAVPGDRFNFQFARNGPAGSDTYVGGITVVGARITGTFWK